MYVTYVVFMCSRPSCACGAAMASLCRFPPPAAVTPRPDKASDVVSCLWGGYCGHHTTRNTNFCATQPPSPSCCGRPSERANSRWPLDGLIAQPQPPCRCVGGRRERLHSKVSVEKGKKAAVTTTLVTRVFRAGTEEGGGADQPRAQQAQAAAVGAHATAARAGTLTQISGD